MSFRFWFRQWRRSVWNLFVVSGAVKHRKSDGERKRERNQSKQRRMSAPQYRLAPKKNKAKRRRSRNGRMIGALANFFVTTVCILLLPIGLIRWGYQSGKQKRKQSQKARQSRYRQPASPAAPQQQKAPQKNNLSERTSSNAKEVKEPKTSSAPSEQVYGSFTMPIEQKEATEKPLDESTPKSIPKSKGDRYIRKRMIVAGSCYCDREVLEKLSVGAYIDLEQEPDNAYDKDAIMLKYGGEKIGYVAKQDLAPFLASIELGRCVYGVITDISADHGRTEYEYETWFSMPQ